MKKVEEEFLKILSRYQGILHKVSLIYFKNENDRQDNFQEIVYQLWKSYPKLEKKESIGSWIYAVSINTSFKQLHRKSKIEYHNNPVETATDDNIVEKITGNERLQGLLNAIQELNDIDKSVMFLYLEDKSHKEIAEILGLSVTNTGTKISRIKKELKTKLNRK